MEGSLDVYESKLKLVVNSDTSKIEQSYIEMKSTLSKTAKAVDDTEKTVSKSNKRLEKDYESLSKTLRSSNESSRRSSVLLSQSIGKDTDSIHQSLLKVTRSSKEMASELSKPVSVSVYSMVDSDKVVAGNKKVTESHERVADAVKKRSSTEKTYTETVSRRVVGSNQTMVQSTRTLTAEQKRNEEATRKQALQQKKLASQMEKDARNLTKYQKAVQPVQRASIGGVMMGQASGMVAGAVGGYVGYNSISSMVNRADEYKSLQSRLKFLTDSHNDYSLALRSLEKTSMDTGSSLTGLVEVFQGISSAKTELGATTKQLLQFTDSVAKLGNIGGASQTEIENALKQLKQSMVGGVVRAEEYGSIEDGLFSALQTVAKNQGLTTGGLRKKMLAGELTSKSFFESILQEKSSVDQDFSKIRQRISQSMGRLETSLMKYASGLDDSLKATEKITNALDRMAGWLENRSSKQDGDLISDTTKKLAIGGGAVAIGSTKVAQNSIQKLLSKILPSKVIQTASNIGGAVSKYMPKGMTGSALKFGARMGASIGVGGLALSGYDAMQYLSSKRPTLHNSSFSGLANYVKKQNPYIGSPQITNDFMKQPDKYSLSLPFFNKNNALDQSFQSANQLIFSGVEKKKPAPEKKVDSVLSRNPSSKETQAIADDIRNMASKQLSPIESGLMTDRERLDSDYKQTLDIIKKNEELGVKSKIGYQKLKLRLEKTYQSELQAIKKSETMPLMNLKESLKTPLQLEKEYYMQSLTTLREAEEQKRVSLEEALYMREELQRQHIARMNEMSGKKSSALFMTSLIGRGAESMFGNTAGGIIGDVMRFGVESILGRKATSSQKPIVQYPQPQQSVMPSLSMIDPPSTSSGVKVTVNITNNTSAKVQSYQNGDTIEVMVGAVEQSIANNIVNGVSPVGSALSSVYQVSKRGY